MTSSVQVQTVDLLDLDVAVIHYKGPATFDEKSKVCSKFLPLCCYGGFASVVVLYCTDVEGHDQAFVFRRFLLGALLFSLSRFVINSAYSLILRSPANSIIVSGVGGAFCGFMFGSLGTTPNGRLSALGFAVGAMLTDYML